MALVAMGRRLIGEHGAFFRWSLAKPKAFGGVMLYQRPISTMFPGNRRAKIAEPSQLQKAMGLRYWQQNRGLRGPNKWAKNNDSQENKPNFSEGHKPDGNDAKKSKFGYYYGSGSELQNTTTLYGRIQRALSRTNRPYTFDDMSALISWLLMGNVLWIVLGTTTFGLVLMYSAHTFDNLWEKISSGDDEEKGRSKTSILSSITGPILSQGLGAKFEFTESSPLPSFKDGMLRFTNVRMKTDSYSSFELDATVQELNISLSFNKWFEGRGLISDLEIHGMHANINKKNKGTSYVRPEKENSISVSSHTDQILHYQNRFNDRSKDESKKTNGDAKAITSSILDANYLLTNVKVRDSYFEIKEENSTLPLRISIFNCELPVLNGDRVLLDFINANNVTGTINDSMFTIHKRQMYDNAINEFDHIIFKLDGIDLKSIANRESVFSWIVEGKAQVNVDLRIPKMNEDSSAKNNFSVEYKSMTSLFSSLFSELSRILSDEKNNDSEGMDGVDKNTILKSALTAIYKTFNEPMSDARSEKSASEYVMVNVKVKFDNIKALLPNSLPMAKSVNLPFISLHNLRSLISFVNSYDFEKKPSIVVQAEVIEKISDFYHVEKLSQTKIFDMIVSDLYGELLHIVKQDEQRILENKSSMWSHSFASQILLLGLGVIV